MCGANRLSDIVNTRLQELFPLGDLAPHKVQVISSCTASKSIASGVCAAEDLYAGQHHLRLMKGIRGASSLNVSLKIVSAGRGLIAGDEEIVPYDETFSGLSSSLILRKSYQLGIPADIRQALHRTDVDASIVLLGDSYLTACDLPDDFDPGHPVFFVHSQSSERRIPRGSGIHRAQIDISDTRIFSAGLVALKGEIGRQLLNFLHCKGSATPP